MSSDALSLASADSASRLVLNPALRYWRRFLDPRVTAGAEEVSPRPVSRVGLQLWAVGAVLLAVLVPAPTAAIQG